MKVTLIKDGRIYKFSEGETCPKISKSLKNICKGEMTGLKARGREIAGKATKYFRNRKSYKSLNTCLCY